MNIIVCVKAVAINVTHPAPTNEGSGISADGGWLMNESDGYALEQALLLKRNLAGTVTAVTLGPIETQDILHVSLAKGADQALRIDADEFDPNIVSFMLARAIRTLNCDLILAGVESSDRMSSQVGGSLAAQLDLPYVYAVTKVVCEGADAPLIVTRELGGGHYQTLRVTKPAVLCVQSGIVALTNVPIVKLVHSRRTAIPGLSLSDLGITSDDVSRRRTSRVVEIKPVEKSSRIQWLSGSPPELAREIIRNITEAL